MFPTFAIPNEKRGVAKDTETESESNQSSLKTKFESTGA